MPENDDALEVKIGSRWGKLLLPLLAAAFGIGGGGAAGTWLAPKASAQDIRQAAENAAEKALLRERELTDEKIGAIKEDIAELKHDVKDGNREQRVLLNDVLQRLPRDPVDR